jgi:hypothetical protein
MRRIGALLHGLLVACNSAPLDKEAFICLKCDVGCQDKWTGFSPVHLRFHVKRNLLHSGFQFFIVIGQQRNLASNVQNVFL